ncbi:hypothetical protein EGW08_009311 [Elysia chlorotica]|uniref:Uncharacterized protein n=1 Tax=Elysia chlorotica TaxID=188477 RepID=A0A433TMX0_ELYCH|nr:hypothetical protein EGW08_009311 [Elysia chlorotica]
MVLTYSFKYFREMALLYSLVDSAWLNHSVIFCCVTFNSIAFKHDNLCLTSSYRDKTWTCKLLTLMFFLQMIGLNIYVCYPECNLLQICKFTLKSCIFFFVKHVKKFKKQCCDCS